MKKLFKPFAIALVSVLLINGCYDDKEETLYRFSQGNCDLTNVTYSLTVAPIIQANCLTCHSGATPSGNLNLQGYSAVAAAVNSNNLYGRITNAANPMPQGGLMDDCSIKKIKTWIDQGLPNN